MLIDGITFAWWEAIEWKDINGRILTTNLRYSVWLTFFSAEIPGWGDLGLSEIKGQSSSTSFRNSALLILKFFFQSSSKDLSSFILRHQRSVRQGFIQKRFFFRGLFLNDLWRQRVIAEFCRTDRRARLFLRLISLLNIRFVNEFDNNCCCSSSGKHVTDGGRHDTKSRSLTGMKFAPVRVFPCKDPLTSRSVTTRGSYNEGSYNQGFLQRRFYSRGFLQPGVVTIMGLKTRGSHNQGFLQPGVLQPAVHATRGE